MRKQLVSSLWYGKPLVNFKELIRTHCRDMKTWYNNKISNVGGVLVGFTMLGVFWLEIYECNTLNLVCAFTNNHTIL